MLATMFLPKHKSKLKHDQEWVKSWQITQVTQFCHIMTLILVLCETSFSFLNIRYCQRYLNSVNLILFTLILVHLFLHVSPHHSHHLHSHHLSLPRSFTPDLKTRLFRKSFSYPTLSLRSVVEISPPRFLALMLYEATTTVVLFCCVLCCLLFSIVYCLYFLFCPVFSSVNQH